MSYEEQSIRWASTKFNIDESLIVKVKIDPTVIYGGYCETCSYEEAGWEVKVYGEDNRLLHSAEYEAWQNSLESLIKEISRS